ncbi:hypothetical protein JAAARDRAFT_41779 [Jaapia argillacea MUCL 33604]|uniref:Nuclear pore complex protein Nup85 n=1 Tax=Jaapia argillacea MUCL 33604 TaxID=933084 RepID=A0A067PJR0_9AGAM|nr:hypothetical protein JAAARDRAFT_41779 [Jaapia argillacea MUCL 33604]
MSEERNYVHLVPPLFEQGSLPDFVQSGRSVGASLSPLDNAIGVFVGPSEKTMLAPTQRRAQEGRMYFASMHKPPTLERRLFITDTSVIFAAFQNLVTNSKARGPEVLRSDDGMRMMGKLANDYVNFCKECWVHASTTTTHLPPQHYNTLYTSFSLFTTLYLPPNPALLDLPVSDDLLEWLNIHFIEPSTEEGDALVMNEKCWEAEGFWDYLLRTTLRHLTKATTFFLNLLSTSHPSPHLRSLSSTLIPLLASHPRLGEFGSEREFVVASKRWKSSVKGVRIELDLVPEDERGGEEGEGEWWTNLSDLVGILEGREEVVLRVVGELGGDWREGVGVWGWVDGRVRRGDLPDILPPILNALPPDPTSVEEMLHLSLFKGDTLEALKWAEKLDPWLAAHLGDCLQALELIGEGDGEEPSARDHYIISYAHYLHSDPALWRLTVDYMCACGDVGKGMGDEVLKRVPLRLRGSSASKQTPLGKGKEREGEGESIKRGEVAGVLKEINQTCWEYGREEVRRMVCRIAAQEFTQEKEYGLAVSYCTSAEDWEGLGRVVDKVLEEYVQRGPAIFTRLVASVAPSLQQLRVQPSAYGPYIHRLMFAVRYAEFHQRLGNQDWQEAALDLIGMFCDDVVPKSWWAVLLGDAVDLLGYQKAMLFSTSGVCVLLQKVEEIQVRTEQGSGDDYLTVLARVTKCGGIKEALHRLKRVRLALARYFARCTVIDVGGKEGGFRGVKG